MKSKSDFWLTLHKVVDDFRREGNDDTERIDSIVAVLEASSSATISAYLENLESATASLNRLLARCKER